jgi:hypothetical protein
MAASDRYSAVGDEDTGSERTAVTAHRSSPERVVFVEQGNPDAWIATDLTVDLRD